MSTVFEGGRRQEVKLLDYPEWGLDIMRGLYGPHTIQVTVNRQGRSRAARNLWREEQDADLGAPTTCDDQAPPLSPLQAELDALEAISDLIVRLIRRRRPGDRRAER